MFLQGMIVIRQCKDEEKKPIVRPEKKIIMTQSEKNHTTS
jgi:hypothetical protein